MPDNLLLGKNKMAGFRFGPLTGIVIVHPFHTEAIMNERQTFRENINFLVRKWGGSQTALAKRLNHVVTQPTISRIQKTGGRRVRRYEARRIEQTMGIPYGLMCCGSLEEAWPLILRFQELDCTVKQFVDDMLRFTMQQRDDQLTQGAR